MNWLKTLWNKIVNNTSVSPMTVEVEEDDKCCGEIFLHILQQAGISKYVKKVNGLELFEEWYDGPCDEENILAAMDDFKAVHPAVAAKMAGKL